MKRSIYLIFLTLFLIPLAFFSSKLNVDNKQWLNKNHPEQKLLDYIKSEYDQGQTLLICINTPNGFFNKKEIALINKIEQSINEISPIILNTKSPLSNTDIFSKNDTLHIETYNNALIKNHLQNIKDYSEIFLKSPYLGRYLSDDNNWVIIKLKLAENLSTNTQAKYESIINSIHTLMKENELKYFISGQVGLQNKLNIYSKKDLKTFLPITILCSFFIMWCYFRQFSIAYLTLITVIISVLFCFITIMLLGQSLTAVNIIIPILVAVNSLADSIHILSRFYKINKLNLTHKNTIINTVKESWIPCLITSITTSFGCIVFFSSEIIPLSEFSIQAVISILGSYFISFFIIITMLFTHKNTLSYKEIKQPLLSKTIKHIISITSKNKGIIFTFSLLVFLFSLYSLKDYKTETSILNVFFKENSQEQLNNAILDSKFNGSGNFELLYINKEIPFNTISSLVELREINKTLLSNPMIKGTLSYLNPIKQIHTHFDAFSSYPKTQDALDQELLFLEFSKSDHDKGVLYNYTDINYNTLRLILETEHLNSTDLQHLINTISKENLLINDTKPHLSGQNIIYHTMSQDILKTQINSIFLTFILIFIIFIILFGIKLSIIGLIVNVIPLSICLGSICLFDIPFDFGTVLVASLTLGLTVDDSIHFLYKYLQLKKNNRTNSIIETLYYTLTPITLSSLILIMAFSIFLQSHLIMVIRFGLFTSIGIITAYISTVILLPVLVQISEKTKQQPKQD